MFRCLAKCSIAMGNNKKINIFKAIAEINRVRILLMLLKKSLCVCELTEILQLSTSTVSKHLSILKNTGFISYEKEGKWINYKIVDNIQDDIIKNILDNLPKWFENDEIIKKDIETIKKIDRNIICNLTDRIKIVN